MRCEKYYIATDEKERRMKLMEKTLFGQTGGTYLTVFAHTHITVLIREHEGKAHLYYDKQRMEIP